MALPVTIPNTFANATSSIPLSQLDANFSTLANAVNGLNSGSETLANLKATTANVGVLTVTGNATIGDASTDTVTLNSTLTANTAVIFAAGTSAAPSITTTGDLNTGIFFPAADTIAFTEGGAEAMRIDSSGNVGIGVTPSAWGGFTALQVKESSLATNGFDNIRLVQNCYYDGSNWRYISSSSSQASRYEQLAGKHQFFTAASGTAGNAITFTQAMTLDASSNLGVGTTNIGTWSDHNAIRNDALQSLWSDATASGIGSNIYYNGQWKYLTTGTAAQYQQRDGGGGEAHIWLSAPSGSANANCTLVERMTLDSSGNLKLSTANSSVLNSSGRKILNQTGGVLQTLNTRSTSSTSTTSDYPVGSGISLAITPSSTSSKILVIVTIQAYIVGDGANTNRIALYGIKNNTSNTFLQNARFGANVGTASVDFFGSISFCYLDSPASTSAQTYEINYGRLSSFNNTVQINGGGAASYDTGTTITLMEIAG